VAVGLLLVFLAYNPIFLLKFRKGCIGFFIFFEVTGYREQK
jgi:hypothetical protein